MRAIKRNARWSALYRPGVSAGRTLKTEAECETSKLWSTWRALSWTACRCYAALMASEKRKVWSHANNLYGQHWKLYHITFFSSNLIRFLVKDWTLNQFTLWWFFIYFFVYFSQSSILWLILSSHLYDTTHLVASTLADLFTTVLTMIVQKLFNWSHFKRSLQFVTNKWPDICVDIMTSYVKYNTKMPRFETHIWTAFHYAANDILKLKIYWHYFDSFLNHQVNISANGVKFSFSDFK